MMTLDELLGGMSEDGNVEENYDEQQGLGDEEGDDLDALLAGGGGDPLGDDEAGGIDSLLDAPDDDIGDMMDGDDGEDGGDTIDVLLSLAFSLPSSFSPS